MINSSIFDNIKIESVKFMEIKENKEKKKINNTNRSLICDNYRTFNRINIYNK